MPKIRIVTLDQAESAPALFDVGGEVQSRAFLRKESDPLHLYHYRLGPGAAMNITNAPNDYVIYVWEGSVKTGEVLLAAGSSLIAEFGASVGFTAGDDGAVVLIFNPSERAADARAGGHVHVLPRENVPRTDDLGTQSKVGGGIHADAQCPTCELWLHENDMMEESGGETAVHSHSEDEIIFVTNGAIRLGQRLYGPGTAIAIAADTKYGFHTGPEGLSFINFRAAKPTVVSADGSIVMDEAEFWHKRVGRPKYLEIN